MFEVYSESDTATGTRFVKVGTFSTRRSAVLSASELPPGKYRITHGEHTVCVMRVREAPAPEAPPPSPVVVAGGRVPLSWN